MQASNSASKQHLLDLAQIKTRLGDKWVRTAGHVERFFETAIRRCLGPGVVRPASADPRLAFAQSVEYLHQSKLAANAPV